MTVFTAPLVVFFTAVTVALFAVGARRLLGLSFSWLRTLVAGVLAFLLAGPIIRSIGASSVDRGRPLLPGLWFVLLGVACALLVGMAFLVLAEAFVPSGSLPGPMYVVRGLRRRLRRGHRYSEIGRLLVRHRLTPYVRGGRRAELNTSDGRARLARSLRAALDEGGVTFVKLGQVLSTRRDLLPLEVSNELAALQDHASPVPWAEIEAVLHRELGAPPAQLFASIDHEPIAAASVAQVHAATLRSSQRVVVKVVRPGVGSVVETDLDIVERIARRLERSTSWGRGIGAVALAQGFAAALREELDLRNEARNLVAVAAGRGAGEGVQLPRPNERLCTAQVLVMQRLDGTAVADNPADPATARRLLHSVLRQVTLDGVFHADPHPGNILLLADGELGLLDLGSVGRLDAGQRVTLQRFLLAVDSGDPLVLTDALLELLDRPDELDERRLERALGRFMVRHVGPGLAPDARMFADLVRLVADHGLAVPPEIAAVFRALATLEGTLTVMCPGFDTIAEGRRFAQAQFADQLRPAVLRQAAQDELVTLLPLLRRVPRRLDRITAAIESGRVSVNVRLLAHQTERRVVTGLVHQVLLTILAATSGVMAVLMLGLRGGPTLTHAVSFYTFLGYVLLVVSSVLALRVLAAVFRPARR